MSGKVKYPIKDCGDEIKEQDFQKVIEATREYGNLSDIGETLLQTAASYVHNETNYVWKNAKVAVLGPDLQLVFVSGYQSYQLVVTLYNNVSVNNFCEEKGWKRMSLESDDVTTAVVWGDIRGTLTDRLLTLLIGLIRRESPQVISPEVIKKTSAVRLRSGRVPNGTGKTLHDADTNGDVTKDRGKNRTSPNRGGVTRHSYYKLVVIPLCVGVALLLTAAGVFIYWSQFVYQQV